MASVTKPILLDETGQAINEALAAIKDAILNTETVEQGKTALQEETERLLATIPQDYTETVEQLSQLSLDIENQASYNGLSVVSEYVDGKYYNGSLIEKDNVYYKRTTPIKICKNQQLVINVYAENKTIGVIIECDENGTPIKYLLLGSESGGYIRTDYKFTEDAYVIVSGRNDKVFDVFVSDITANQSDLQALKTELTTACETSENHVFYARVENPSPCDYTNSPIKIMVNFKDGVCKSKECIKVSDTENADIPFDFYPCVDDNLLLNYDYTYYSSGYVRSAYLIITDTLAKGESKDYTATIYPNELERTWEKIGTFVSEYEHTYLNVGEHSVIGGRRYKYGMEQFDGKVFNSYFGYLDNGSNVRESDGTLYDSLLDSKLYTLGDGYNCLTVIRELVFSDKKFIQWLTLHKSGILSIKNAVAFMGNVSTGETYYTRHFFHTQNAIKQNVGDMQLFTFKNESTGAENVACPIYCNGNSQRDNQSLPIYDSAVTATVNTSYLDIMQKVTLSNTDYWQSGFIHVSEFMIKPYEDENEGYRFVNELLSTVATENKGTLKKGIIEKLSEIAIFAKENAENEIELSHVSRAMYEPFMELVNFLNNTASIRDVISAYYYMKALYYKDSVTTDSIMSVYQTYGLEFIGRSLPITYYLFRLTREESYKNDLIAYATMLSDLITASGDIPLHYNGTANSNSRCMALYALALAIELTDNSAFISAFETLKALIDNDVQFGTIQPEGNLLTGRYLHYTSFANFYYALALKHCGESGMESTYNYMLQSVLPNGQIKDLEYCTSDSRRGKSHTYAYVAGVLALSDNVSSIQTALNVLAWLNKQLPINGNTPNMLDGYTTYITTANPQAFPLTVTALMELNFNLLGMWKL